MSVDGPLQDNGTSHVHGGEAAHVTQKHRFRPGHWLPKDHHTHHHWLRNLIHHVDKQQESQPRTLDPVLQDFENFIDKTPHIHQLAQDMFTQVPAKHPYRNDPSGTPQPRDYHHMLQLINEILTRAPAWDAAADKVGLIASPINAILDWPMGTQAGYKFFRTPEVNEHFAKVLKNWSSFLSSPQSAYVLSSEPGGWLSKKVLAELEDKANTGTGHLPFDQLYECQPDQPHYGFKSWDDFFTRKFRHGVRPVCAPDDNHVIVNCCESATFRLTRNVKLKDEFELKGQPYSLQDMLDHDPTAADFEHGWVYQAYLSALTYHRWHSPVDGTVVKTKLVPGTYYSESPHQGFASGKPDEAAPNNSQAYIAHVAARGLIWIQADHPCIGLICIVQVGMAEVSSCDIRVQPGQHLKKGDEIGMFHFGGSTFCLLLRPGIDVVWRVAAEGSAGAEQLIQGSGGEENLRVVPDPHNLRVNDCLAVVGSNKADAMERASKLWGKANGFHA